MHVNAKCPLAGGKTHDVLTLHVLVVLQIMTHRQLEQ